MSYIKQITRRVIDPAVQLFFDRIKKDNWERLKSSELNYIITKIIHWWVLNKGVNYQNLHDAKGILIDVKDEFVRLIMDPYEDKKKEENGCISELDRITREEKLAIWKCNECGFIFNDDEVHETISSYTCPGCEEDCKNWTRIRKNIN